MAVINDPRIPADLVSVSQAAALLGRSRQAILKMINAGHLPARRVGNDYVMRRVEVARHHVPEPMFVAAEPDGAATPGDRR